MTPLYIGQTRLDAQMRLLKVFEFSAEEIKCRIGGAHPATFLQFTCEQWETDGPIGQAGTSESPFIGEKRMDGGKEKECIRIADNAVMVRFYVPSPCKDWPNAAYRYERLIDLATWLSYEPVATTPMEEAVHGR